MPSALSGLKVVDLTNVGPGAHCTRILADLGADVIRVLEARSRSGSRQWQAPPWIYGMRRNTRPIGLDLKREKGAEAFHRIVARSDVLMVGMRPSAAERLGIDYDAMHVRHPRLIYCSITGYGATGPYRNLAGHDINYQSIGGAMAMNGPEDGPPTIPGATAADSAGGGMQAVIGILTALYARTQTGAGQLVDVSATDGIVSMMSPTIDEYLATGIEPVRGRTLLTGLYPWYNVYETKDGRFVSVGAIEPQFYANLCRCLDLEDLIPDQYAEGEHKAEIVRRFRAAFLTRDRDEWMARFEQVEACATPVYSIAEMVHDPNLLQREVLIDVEHPRLGRLRQTGIMVKLSDTPGSIRHVDPRPEDFSENILLEAGYTSAEVESLRAEGVVD